MTPLQVALSYGDNDAMHRLAKDPRVDRDAPINWPSWRPLQHFGWRPLHLAACEGRCDTIKVLLGDAKVDRNAVTSDGQTALHIAVDRSQVRAHEVLSMLRAVDVSVMRYDVPSW